MSALPWNERVPAISINPHMASIDDIAKLASENMSLRAELASLQQENAHLRKVNGIQLKKTTIKQSLVFANDALDAKNREILELKSKMVNEYAHAQRIVDWLKSDKPANLAFTEGPERQVAYAIEGLRNALKFYADRENYKSRPGARDWTGVNTPVNQDGGQKAREGLLNQTEKEK